MTPALLVTSLEMSSTHSDCPSVVLSPLLPSGHQCHLAALFEIVHRQMFFLLNPGPTGPLARALLVTEIYTICASLHPLIRQSGVTWMSWKGY